jgi:hypothetical protein
MDSNRGKRHGSLGRRGFLKTAGPALGASVFVASTTAASSQTAAPEPIAHAGAARPLTEKEKLARIASNTWPIRYIFKTRGNFLAEEQTVAQMKKKYGEITMLDFPDFTKRTFPGVYQMDLFSGLFGDMDDDSMYVKSVMDFEGTNRTVTEFDPSSASGKKWLEKMARKQVITGTKCHHISNNAPRDICDLNPEKRKAGIEVAKKWLDGAAMLGAKSMRVNSGGPRIAPSPIGDASSYPKTRSLPNI